MDLFPPVDINDHTKGPDTAPVTLVEFGDYQCPYCGEAQKIISALAGKFGEQLRYVFRNYPLVDIHPDAMAAARIAEAASQEQFWYLHDALYANQDALDDASLVRYAVDAGVSEAQAHAALAGSTDKKIKADIASGDRSGIKGTPAFFINGKRHDGDWSEAALSGSIKQAESRVK